MASCIRGVMSFNTYKNMNKKTIIKYIVGAVVLYVAYSFFFGAKAEAQEVAKTWEVQGEVGQYEKRIDTGAYTGDDAAFVKLSTDLGVIGGLSLVGDLEYVNTDDYQVYATVGTELNTFIGVLGVYGEYSTVEAGEGLFEVGAAYGLNLFGLDTVVAASANEDSAYSAELSTEYALYSGKAFALSIGAAYGQTFETQADYDYTLGFARISTTGPVSVFVTVNYLNSDAVNGTDGVWEATTDFGVAFSF